MTEQKPNSGSYVNFYKTYANDQMILANENVEDWLQRRHTLRHDLDEAERELKHWESVRDFYKKAKEAE